MFSNVVSVVILDFHLENFYTFYWIVRIQKLSLYNTVDFSFFGINISIHFNTSEPFCSSASSSFTDTTWAVL